MEDLDSSNSTPPSGTTFGGQRMLAAIVFTDTVGFSALAAQNEEHALSCVHRDLDRMRVLCDAFGGQTIKGTGDGVLMMFVSAVQAVSCSLEIQRDIHQNNLALNPKDRLQHRIGIHLGDVFLNGTDVLGDGVNIAARLQTAAQPGGVCVSHTVYDVVNNRVKFHINELGERKLKNIGKLKAYQISPMEGGPNSPGNTSLPNTQKVPWLYYSAVGLGGLIVMLIVLGALKGKHKTTTSDTGHTPTPVAHVDSTPVPNPTAVVSNTTPAPSVAPIVVTPGNIALVKQLSLELDAQKDMYLKKYDFNGLRNWLATHQHLDVPDYQKHADALEGALNGISDVYKWWLAAFKKNYSQLHPLVITDTTGNTHSFYPDVSGNAYYQENTISPVLTPYDEINPKVTVTLIEKTIREEHWHFGWLGERAKLESDLEYFRRSLRPVQSTNPSPAPESSQ